MGRTYLRKEIMTAFLSKLNSLLQKLSLQLDSSFTIMLLHFWKGLQLGEMTDTLVVAVAPLAPEHGQVDIQRIFLLP